MTIRFHKLLEQCVAGLEKERNEKQRPAVAE
jgi:hypothetical protein